MVGSRRSRTVRPSKPQAQILAQESLPNPCMLTSSDFHSSPTDVRYEGSQSCIAILQARAAITRGRTMANATAPAKVPKTTVCATQATSCGNNASHRYLGTGGMVN